MGFSRPSSNANNISPVRSKILFVAFLCVFFIAAALFSVPAPFFPSRAMEKGVSQTLAGVILGSMQVVQFVAAVIFSVTVFHFGPKFMLCFGIIWASSCSILFGVMDLGPNDASYPTLCLLVRLVQGIGVSSYYISCTTITAVLFSEKYGMTTGMLQTFYSLGCIFGPTIGGILYSVGGYICPFAVIGGILMLFSPLLAIIVPGSVVTSMSAVSRENPIQVFRNMMTPSFCVLFYTMLVGTMTTVFTETTLGVRVADFGITDPLIVGCIYLSSSGAYAVTAPIAGMLADEFDIGWAVMFTGTCVSALGYLIIGPSPMFGVQASLPQTIFGAFISHCGIAGVLVPMTRELQRVAKANGLEEDNPSTFSFISAVFDMGWGVGGFIGSFIAGTLMENLGFPMATTIQALVLIPSIFMQIFLNFKYGHFRIPCARSQAGYIKI